VRGDPANCGACSHPSWPEATDVFNPSTKAWTRISADPIAMTGPVSTWTGNALLSFDTSSQIGSHGQLGHIGPGAASLYDTSTRRWSMLAAAPFGCTNGPTPIWTGYRVLIYCPSQKAAGLVYTPARAQNLKVPAPRALSGFNPLVFTAAGAKDWWVLGSAPCHRTELCPAMLRTTDGGLHFEKLAAPSSGISVGNEP
jgi:hypothetical protein